MASQADERILAGIAPSPLDMLSGFRQPVCTSAKSSCASYVTDHYEKYPGMHNLGCSMKHIRLHRLSRHVCLAEMLLAAQ